MISFIVGLIIGFGFGIILITMLNGGKDEFK